MAVAARVPVGLDGMREQSERRGDVLLGEVPGTPGMFACLVGVRGHPAEVGHP